MICYLLRHGKDDDTVRGGWCQNSLTEEGTAQAAEAAARIEKGNCGIRRIYSSDLPRAVETAAPVAEALRLQVISKAEFREVNNGHLAGMPNVLAEQRYPGLYWNTLGWEQQYPGGESPREFCERITKAWDTFQQEIREADENVLLVTHGGVMQVILALVNGREYSNQKQLRKIGYTELIALESRNGGWIEGAAIGRPHCTSTLDGGE